VTAEGEIAGTGIPSRWTWSGSGHLCGRLDHRPVARPSPPRGRQADQRRGSGHRTAWIRAI